MNHRGRTDHRTSTRRGLWLTLLTVIIVAAACSSGGDETAATPAAGPADSGLAVPTPAATSPPPTGESPTPATGPAAVPDPSLETTPETGVGRITTAPPARPTPVQRSPQTFLAPGLDHAISGFVVDSATGAPLRGVRVTAGPDGPSATTDRFGFYRVDGLPPGRYEVTAQARGFAPASGTVETETWTRLDLELTQTGSKTPGPLFDIIGAVTDRDTGVPVAGAAVRITGGGDTYTVKSGAGGAYRLPPLPSGSYTFEVELPGYVGYSESVDLSEDIATEVFLRAMPATLRGRVVDGASGDTPQAVVEAVGLDASGRAAAPSESSVTDATGAYAIDGIPPGSYRVSVLSAGYSTRSTTVDLPPGGAITADFDLSLETASLRVVLVSSTYGGMPLSGMEVAIAGVDGTPGAGMNATVVTGTGGEALFAGLPPGAYEVSTPSPSISAGQDTASLYPMRAAVRLGAGENRTLAADLPARGGDVHGLILGGTNAGDSRLATTQRSVATIPAGQADADESLPYISAPLAGATVTVVSARFGDRTIPIPATSVRSGAQGGYVLPLPPGTYTIQTSRDGHVKRSVDVSIGSQPSTLDITLARATTNLAGRIDGTMFEDRTNNTSAAFRLTGARVLLQRGGKVFAAETDDRGVFLFRDLPLDTAGGSVLKTEYDLTVSHPDYLPLNDTLTFDTAEGVRRIVRSMPTLAAGGFLEIALSVTDKDGVKFATTGTLESLINLRSQDVYDARFIEDSDTVEIPNRISIRARPGLYRARVCAATQGLQPCVDSFWTSVGGVITNVDLGFNCVETDRLVKCSPSSASGVVADGHIVASGFVYSASNGKPLADARVTVAINVLTEYCGLTCTGFVREMSLTGPTGPNGRYQLEFQVPETNGGAELTSWSWDDADRSITASLPGYVTAVQHGQNEPVRLFDGSQDFYLAPSGRLDALVIGSVLEAAPVDVFDNSLGAPVTNVDGSARVTLSPLGADLSTGPAGTVSFATPPGAYTVRVDSPRHYPYSGKITLPAPVGDEPVAGKFTFVLETIPPPAVRTDTFNILSAADGEPLRGYILRGISADATRARWQVRVNRNGVRPLRPGFDDPVQAVDLLVSVREGCDGVPGPVDPIRLRGALTGGSANATGTWSGVFDVSDLPCGSLDWTVEARTSRSVADHTFDWPLWPAEQRYPLSQLTQVAGTARWAPETADGVAGPASLAFDAVPGSLRVVRDGEYLSYEFPGVSISADFGRSPQSEFLAGLAGTSPAPGRFDARAPTALLSGQTGALTFRANSAGSAGDEGGIAYRITSESLFALDTPVPPPSEAGTWGESLEGETSDSRVVRIPRSSLPAPLGVALAGVGVGELELSVTSQTAAGAAWNLAPPPAPGDNAPGPGERLVTAGTQFTVNSSYGATFDLSVMDHLRTAGAVTSEATSQYRGAGADAGGPLRATGFNVSGTVETGTDLWRVWEVSRSAVEYPFFNRKPGGGSIARSASRRVESRWLDRPAAPLAGARPAGPDAGLIATGGLDMPSISAAVDSGGGVVAALLADDGAAGRPGAIGVSLLRRDGSGAWSGPDGDAPPVNGMVLGTAITVDAEGRTVLVWPEVAAPADTPAGFVRAAASAELLYSVFDNTAGVWSAPRAITDDDRPDFAPVVAADGDGRIVLAWARDMDGSVLTTDDIVVYASEWIKGRWSRPVPVMQAPGARSTLAVSAAPESAVIGVVADTSGGEPAVMLSFNRLGRWSSPNVIAAGRDGLRDVAVAMERPGLALVAWNESGPAEATAKATARIVTVEATSAGLRGETAAASGINGLVDFNLSAGEPGRPVLSWTAGGGSSLAVAALGPGGWSGGRVTALPGDPSHRFLALPSDGGRLITLHETGLPGSPGITFLSVAAP